MPKPVVAEPALPKPEAPEKPKATAATTVAGVPLGDIPEYMRDYFSQFPDEPSPPETQDLPEPKTVEVEVPTPPPELKKVVENHLKNYFGI